MIHAVRFQKNEFAEEAIARSGLKVIEKEVRVYFAQRNALLPILIHGENRLVTWGNKSFPQLPRTGFCKQESFEAGKWRWLQPLPVDIPASAALVNGVWFQVKQGIQGVLLESGRGSEHCYIMTQPATHYFRTMTGAERMPVLLNQIL